MCHNMGQLFILLGIYSWCLVFGSHNVIVLANWHLSAGISSRCEEHKAPLVMWRKNYCAVAVVLLRLSIDDDPLLLQSSNQSPYIYKSQAVSYKWNRFQIIRINREKFGRSGITPSHIPGLMNMAFYLWYHPLLFF